MPIYEFKCTACGLLFEEIVPLSKKDDQLECPNCHGESKPTNKIYPHQVDMRVYGGFGENK